MLKINHLTKLYHGTDKGVKEICMHVAKGEIHAFIGPNGAGKTTLLKCISDIHRMDAGDITVDGVSLLENPLEAKKRMAYIPDNPDLYDYLTGIQFLNFVADVFSIGLEERKEAIRRYADAFELTSSLGNLISTYSHGMKQKLSIIAALLHAPKLLVLDEPFVGLDPKASVTLKNFMREICERGGAILYSTHVLDVAERLADSVTIIKDGCILTAGRMEDTVKPGSTLEDLFMEVAGNA